MDVGIQLTTASSSHSCWKSDIRWTILRILLETNLPRRRKGKSSNQSSRGRTARGVCTPVGQQEQQWQRRRRRGQRIWRTAWSIALVVRENWWFASEVVGVPLSPFICFPMLHKIYASSWELWKSNPVGDHKNVRFGIAVSSPDVSLTADETNLKNYIPFGAWQGDRICRKELCATKLAKPADTHMGLRARDILMLTY